MVDLSVSPGGHPRPPVPPKPRTLSQSQGAQMMSSLNSHSPPRGGSGRGVVDDRDGNVNRDRDRDAYAYGYATSTEAISSANANAKELKSSRGLSIGIGAGLGNVKRSLHERWIPGGLMGKGAAAAQGERVARPQTSLS